MVGWASPAMPSTGPISAWRDLGSARPAAAAAGHTWASGHQPHNALGLVGKTAVSENPCIRSQAWTKPSLASISFLPAKPTLRALPWAT